ncbi:unnamed protein product [Clonostachys rosea]|uniref:Rgp1-domain-containing protein n=1 Tax=Bionectria ochroleuca TaxID=29856 RepID=A0ABY6UVB1_BIOOC|nr:unnamed protein product [Clonostachys rosea]
MAPPHESSHIRVFIRWHDQTVFAGEEVKCTITFKNVASSPEEQRQRQQQEQAQQANAQSDRHRLTSSLHARAKPSPNLSSPPLGKGHRRAAHSVSVPASDFRSRSGSVQWPSPVPASDGRPGHAHKRSLSILSFGSAVAPADDHTLRNESALKSPRPMRAHNRSASLQISPRVHGSPIPGPPSGTKTKDALAANSISSSPRMNNSLLHNASYPPDRFGRTLPPPGSGTHTPNSGAPRRSPRRSPLSSPMPMPEFRFPAAPPPSSSAIPSRVKPTDENLLSPRIGRQENNSTPTRLKEQILSERPAARILSSTSLAGGTPRSSGEFYSMSNNSSETLASEYTVQPPARSSSNRPLHLRRNSSIASSPQLGASESLMMGYAQIQGSFSLDGSLVSLGAFEAVKKKAVVGGRGGGVVGLETTNQRESGLLRSFGWGSISNSFGELLNKSELSTIKEMRGVANSKAIPLLNTPQSILFVDLQLAPGQSRMYEYTFRLPKGLPPTHKGKAIKVSYSLVIGTQRVGGAREQHVRSVEVPFRVLGGVNSVGEILGHDLMNPYVLLRDEAKVETLGEKPKSHKNKAPSRTPATMNDFSMYVDELVARAGDHSRGLLSPSAIGGSRRPSMLGEESESREAIDLAILRSNMTTPGQQSPNRFEISRNGSRVGVVMLARPSYRLGEMVTMVIDLVDTDISCYAIHMSLETSEKVDASLAVRSESSIHRVTRKVYATSSDSALYSRRVVFTPTIPITATPEFITSGVGFEWKIRVEFVVPSRDENSVDPGYQKHHPLLEKISQDDRGGLLLAAVENLACESFDVLVPLRVYGAVGTGLERLERDEASEEGLAV